LDCLVCASISSTERPLGQESFQLAGEEVNKYQCSGSGSESIWSQGSGSDIINFRSGYSPFSQHTIEYLLKMYQKVSKFNMITHTILKRLKKPKISTHLCLHINHIDNFFSPSLVFRRIRVQKYS